MADGEPTTTHKEKHSPMDSSHQDLQHWLERSSDEGQKGSSARRGLAGSLFEATFRLLSSLQEIVKDSSNVTYGEKRQCQNEMERLFLWGDGFGAKDGSLDDILDHSAELKMNVLSLLCELGKVVNQNIFKVINPSNPSIHEESADVRMLLETAEAVLSEEGQHRRNSLAFSDSDSSDGDFAEGIEDIASYTDCLMDLAPALEHPAIDLELKEKVSEIETFQVSSAMAANYCRKIRDQFPRLDIRIVERLGESNQKRSQRLQESYVEVEVAAMKDVGNPEDVSEPLFSRSGGKHTETTESAYVSESIFSTDQRIGVSKEHDDTASQTTFATFSTAFSTMKQGIPRVPSLPNSARSGKPFQCLACGKTLRTVRNRRVWKKHIFNDLQPYVCTITPHTGEDCFKTFSSRSAWIKHEATHHGSENQHIKCSFCPPTNAGRPTNTHFKHLSRHLREVALAVLPQSHDSDTESEAGSTSSQQAMSEISSLRGHEPELRPISQTGSSSSLGSSVIDQIAASQALAESDVPITSTEELAEPIGKSENPPILGNKPINEVEDAQTRDDNPKRLAVEQDETKQRKVQPCHYKTGKTLGANSYSVIKECVHIETGRYYAAKVINKRRMIGKEYLIRNEIAVLKRVSMGHRNLLTLVDYFETQNNLYLVTDLTVGGDLFDRVLQKGSYNESDTVDVIRAVVSGVAYIHDHGIIHRGLRPESVLFRTPEENAEPLVTDFGSSWIIDFENENLDSIYMDKETAVLGYAAPEVLKEQPQGKPLDMWSIGVITYFLLCGYTPFDRDTGLEEHKAILSADYSFTPSEYWKDISLNAKEFIKRCLVLDPKHRMTAHEALSHRFLRQADEASLSQPAPQLLSKKPMAIAARRVWKVAIVVVIACHRFRRGQSPK